MTLRHLASVAAVLAAATAASVVVAAPAGADPNALSNSVSTAAGAGAARVDATCHFGPVVPDNFEDQMVIAGVATAPGAVSTTVRCYLESYGDDGEGLAGTAEGPVATVADSAPHWRGADRVCVSAEADFGGTLGTVVVAPKVCA